MTPDPQLKAYVDEQWNHSALPAMEAYLKIPAISPAYDENWQADGYLDDVLHLVEKWCREQALEGCTIHTISDSDRTPLLLIEIEASSPEIEGTTLLYGHLDKQPPSEGWDENKGPWLPVLENDRLYGRGAADDGYAVFSSVIALKALQTNGTPHGRCVILIETCEESGSYDLVYYLESQKEIIGTPDLIICLDSDVGDYERFWIAPSLRGTFAVELKVALLTQGIHSGFSGRVASSFRVMRKLLDRIEDADTGEILLRSLHTPIPENRRSQIKEAAEILQDRLFTDLPLVHGGRPMHDDPVEVLTNASWRPTLSYIGCDGIPPVANAGNVLRHFTSLKLSFRIPPGVNAEKAVDELKTTLETDPPYGASVSVRLFKQMDGWDMPTLGESLESRINAAAKSVFGHPPAYLCEGGSIPFMTLLAEKFPEAKFIVTGVLGPHANAHGPNESLHIPYVKRLTHCIALILSWGPQQK